MNSKMNQRAQSPEYLSLLNQRAEEELMTFQLAIASYPERASREPGVTFHQHLRSFLATIRDEHGNRSSRG
jgi:hypothetical protein